MQKKKILIICKGHQNIAGAQLYLKQISLLFTAPKYELHFASHIEEGIRVFKEIGKTCCVYQWEYDWRHLAFLKSLSTGRKLFKKIKPDLVIFNSSEDKIFAPIWASMLAGIRKRIMVCHWAQSAKSFPLLRLRFGLSVPIPSLYSFRIRLVRALGLRPLHRIIFVNNMTREAYLKLYGVSKKRCCTIYNGIDLEDFSKLEESRSFIRNELGIKTSEIMIFAAGNLTEVKGYEYLIKAVQILIRRNFHVKCFIAGDGEIKQSLEGKIEEMNLRSNVRLLGYRDDIPILLAAGDIFCMPSLNEALGYSLLEAMAAGLPVVASYVGGIPEVITNGREGFLVIPKNLDHLCSAIEKLFRDSMLRKNMGLKGKETVKIKFSIERMIRETKTIILGELMDG